MNFTRKSRQSTVKHEETSKFRWFANNFCRKNTGFSVDFHFFDDKKWKNMFILVFLHPKSDENTIKHMVFRRKSADSSQIRAKTRRRGPERRKARRNVSKAC